MSLSLDSEGPDDTARICSIAGLQVSKCLCQKSK